MKNTGGDWYRQIARISEGLEKEEGNILSYKIYTYWV